MAKSGRPPKKRKMNEKQNSDFQANGLQDMDISVDNTKSKRKEPNKPSVYRIMKAIQDGNFNLAKTRGIRQNYYSIENPLQ
jgi:hypothetical protein